MSSYTCSNCNHTSNSKWNLKKHIEVVCPNSSVIENIVKLSCSICDKQFTSEKYLKQHQKNCMEKKALIVKEYVGAENINDTINIMKTTIKSLNEKIEKSVKRIDELEKDVKELRSENEKLKSKKEKTELQKINGEEDGIFCDKTRHVSFVPLSRKHLRDTLKKYNITEHITANLTVSGQRSNIVEGDITEKDYIECDGVKYYYDLESKAKGRRYTNELKVIVNEMCQNYALYKKDECHFCEEHKVLE